jgi:hypothetical protein
MNNDEVPELDEGQIDKGHYALVWDDIPLDGSRFYIVERDEKEDGTIMGTDSIGYITAYTENTITVEYDWSRNFSRLPNGFEHYSEWEYNAEGEPSGNNFELTDLPKRRIKKETIDNLGSSPKHFITLFEHEYKAEVAQNNVVQNNVAANNMNMPLIRGLIASAPDPNILIRRTNGPGLTVKVARSRRRRRQKKRRQRKTRRQYGI